MNAWSNLPNAAHIDRILLDLTENPEAWNAARGAARGEAWSSIFALIAWDDCADLLDCNPDEVQTMSLLGNHAAVLLLPAVIALKGDVL